MHFCLPTFFFRLSLDEEGGFYPGCRLHGHPPSLLMVNGDEDGEDEEDEEDEEEDEDEDERDLRELDLRETDACLRSRRNQQKRRMLQQQRPNGTMATR